MANTETRLTAIEECNARVADDKAWEVSWSRRGLIAAFIYGCGVVMLMTLGHDGAFKHAFVPVMGYLLSTLSLPEAKKMWLANRQKTGKETDNVTIH